MNNILVYSLFVAHFFNRVRLPMRGTSTRLVAKGLFKGAEVVRGYDWLWGDQDGKNKTWLISS